MELGPPLSAEVTQHVGVPVRLLEQLNLPPDQAEAFTEEPLDSHCPSLKLTPGRWGDEVQRGQIKERLGTGEQGASLHPPR